MPSSLAGGGGGGGKERARLERYTPDDVDSDSEQPGHRGACSDDHSLAISMQEAESAAFGCCRHEPPTGDAELAQCLAHKEVGPRLRPHPRPRMPRVDPPA